jgi:inhibitor of KinA
MNPFVYPCGESAITFDLGGPIDAQRNSTILSMRKNILADPFPGLVDVVTGYSSLTLIYDWPLLHAQLSDPAKSYQHLERYLTDIYNATNKHDTVQEILHRIPVCYDPLMAQDLVTLSDQLKLDAAEIIKLHHEAVYNIYMIGFLPGFPYLGLLPDKLFSERKRTPAKVPAGAVAIAGRQTGIYPFSSPGGWNIIGRTPVTLFDPSKYPPVKWQAGDQVKFFPISLDEFNQYQDP